MAKYYFYYNADDGTIEEITRQAGLDGAYTFQSTGSPNTTPPTERHFTDGSTFMPFCNQWSKNQDSIPGITGVVDSFNEAFIFNDALRFGMHPGVWLGGSFTVLGKVSSVQSNGSTLLGPWSVADWQSSNPTINPCLNSSPASMTVSWGLVYSPNDTGFDTIYNGSTTGVQYIDSVEGNGLHQSDGLNNDGNTNGGSGRARGADAKIRLLLADDQLLDTGYYAIDIGNSDDDVLTATTAQGNPFTSHINDAMIEPAANNTFWGVPKRWVVSPTHLSNLGLQTQSSFDIIDSVSSGSSNIQANGDITWTVTLDSVYYNTTPLHGITNEATRELGYIIWKSDGTTVSIVGDTTTTGSLQRKVTLTRAGSGSAQNGTVDSSRRFTVTLPSSEVLNNHQYYIQFFETPDTYRFTKTNTNATLSNVDQWDGWYDTYGDILTHIVNGASPTLSVNSIETTFPHSVVNRSQTTADNDLTGFMAGVTEIPMCNDTVKYVFQVGNGTGEIISTASSSGGVFIKGLIGPASESAPTNAKFNTDELYCEVNWTDTIYAKNVIGVASQWSTQTQAENASLGQPRTGIKISGSAKSDKGSLFAFEGTTPLDNGWYVVCTPAKTAGNVLTNPVPNSNLQITSTSTGVGTLTVNVNTVLAANNSSAGNTNGCWDGKRFKVLLFGPGGAFVSQQFETVGQTGWQSQTFSGLSSGSYTVQLKSGQDSNTLASQMHIGVSLDALLDESTGISVTAPWCTNNLHAFQVQGGKVVTNSSGRKGFKVCGTSADFITFSNGLYCDAAITIHKNSGNVNWANESEVCSSSAATQMSNVVITGRQTSAGGDISISDANGALADGWYAYCGTESANTNINISPVSSEPCASGTMYFVQVGTGGEISTLVNGLLGGSTATLKGFPNCNVGGGQSFVQGTPGISFPAGAYCDGGANNGIGQQITLFAKSSTLTDPQWQSSTDACLACNAASITVDIRGNTSGTITASSGGNTLPQGIYSYCHPSSGGNEIAVTPNPSCQNEYFIYISTTQGNWDGKIYECDGSIAVQVGQDDWFDESKLLNYTVKPDSTPWSGSAPPSAPPTEACGICSDQASDKGALYVSGTKGDVTDSTEELKIYSSAGEQNPLTTGWYRSCSNSLPVVNGVVPERPKFNCYGNPFIWYSLKNSSSTVVDENSYLTNGDVPWYKDAPLKDLTSTGCDLGVAGWDKEGQTSKTTIPRGTYTSVDNSSVMQCNGVTGGLLDFNPSGPYLTRSKNYWYPNPETGQKIISSPKTSATEVTIALVVECETVGGTIFKINDVSTVEGSGEYDKLSTLEATLSTIELKKVTGSSSPLYELTTSNLDFSNNSPSTVQNSIQVAAATSGYELIVITLSDSGHSIRVGGGNQTASNSNASNFCSAVGGITNLNVEIGDNKDDTDNTVDMNFLEMIIYDEELNLSEIKELEGYLSHKWCLLLPESSHPYRAAGPVCGGCDDDCCDSSVATYSTTHSSGLGGVDSWKVQCFYASSEPVFGYQFKLTGLNGINGMDIPNGFYEEGPLGVDCNGKTFTLSFEDPLFKSFKNYIEVTSTGVWVYGHFNQHSSPNGGFDYVLPKAVRDNNGDPTERFLNIIFTETTSPNQVMNWAALQGIGTNIVSSAAQINTPAAPHPLLVTDISAGQQVVSSYTGDVTGDGNISRVDVRGIVERISDSHDSGPYDLSGSSWLETLDANGKGWLDISDAVTCLLNLIRMAGTHIGNPAPSTPVGSMKLMSGPICSEKLTPTKCEPCPCPDETEDDEECISRAWISDIQQIDTKTSLNSNFAVVTVKYQSSCCLDGYKLTLGGFNEKIVNSAGGFHDGAVLVPSYGNSIGQLSDSSETHLRGWLHGLTLDPNYKGEVAFQNASEVFAINTNVIGDFSILGDKQFENKLKFPIVWGMSLGQNPLIPTTADEKLRREEFESGRLGINCIPATCKGESRVLTKFIINMRSFTNPHIAEFRLVTNDAPKTPASFGPSISWTGDSAAPADGISGADFAAALVYMYSGWGPATTWDNPALSTTMPSAISLFDAENDDSYIDVVDSLTVMNHILMKGNDVPSDNSALVVPTDCCPCPVPGSFTVSLDINPCDCSEEGYVAGKEGIVTVTWTASAEADMYAVYRVLEEYNEPSSIYSTLSPWTQGLFTNKKLLDIDNKFTTEAIFTGKNKEGQSQTISDFGKVQLYKDKVTAGKSQTDFDKWTLIGKFRNDTTSVVDNNPVKFDKCCPDDTLPRVKYIVVAVNDCGEKNSSASYVPECCGDKPAAENVDIGTLAINDLASLYADVFHPHAMNPYGGQTVQATASITINSVPSTTTTVKIIAWDGTINTYTIAGGNPAGAATALAAAVNGHGKITAVADGAKVNLTQGQATACGNTKITVTGETTAITADTKFTGGNKQCVPTTPGYPERCEKLAFFITSVTYSDVRSGDGLFVGPSGGASLPAGNLTGLWSWKPPADYIGNVTFTYIVINESGCSDEAKITINYAPPKLILDCETPGCDDEDYGKIKIKMQLPDVGNAAKFTVLRKPVTAPETPWNVGTHTLQDADGSPLTFYLADYPDNVFMFVDESVTAPDECCDAPLSYQYKIIYCLYNTLMISPVYNKLNINTSDTAFSCAESTVCTVTIPCCPKPHNAIPSVNVTQDCSATKYASVVITWGAIVESDNPYLYLVYKRKQGTTEWNEVVAVDATPEGKAASNPYWDSGNTRYEFTDDIKTSSVCAASEVYEYAIVTMNADKKLSGDPSDTSWGSWQSTAANQGDPCSPGGTTVTATVANCPPSICVEDMNVSICLDEDFEYDLAGFVGCIPLGVDGNPVPVSYALTSSESWVTPSLSGSVLTFDTRNIDFGTGVGQVGTGPHAGAIRVTVSTSAPCASSDVLDINIILVDCGCPCASDEADYTICDNNYDNEEYVEASKLQNNLEQIPFSLTNEGGQALRKGQPYIVSKGKIDCD